MSSTETSKTNSNSTESSTARTLAGALFDEMIVPLAAARNATGQQTYFPLALDAEVDSYYAEPLLRRVEPTDFEFPREGTAAGLIDALAAYWSARGEGELTALTPQLKEIAAAMADEATAGDGSVSILCYTMF